MLDVDLSGLFEVLGDVEKLAGRIEPASEVALDAVAAKGKADKQGRIDRTYRRTIPKTSTGRDKWKRSGAWKNGQRIRKTAGTREIVTEGPATEYEESLRNRPTGPDGINRSNDAGGETHEFLEQNAPGTFEETFQRELNL